MNLGITEKSHPKVVYGVLLLVFITITGTFYYINEHQKKAIYNFVYNYELQRQKKVIKLETYAAVSFINSYTKSVIHNTFKNLAYKLQLIKLKLNQNSESTTDLIKLKNSIKTPRLALFFDNGTSTVDFLNLNDCEPYLENINIPFNDIHLYICTSKEIKEGAYSGRFLLATTKVKNNITFGAYESMLEIELQIIDNALPKLSRFIFANKTRDSYFFVGKILNIKGGDNFALVLYNKSKGIIVGKVISSKKTDIKGHRFREEYLKGLREKGETYVSYWYPSPTTRKPRLKISFIKYYKPLHWTVGTGFYVDCIKNRAAVFTNNLFKLLNYFQLLMLILYTITIILIHITNTQLTKTASRDTNLITSAIPKIGVEKEPIDLSKIQLIKLKTIAEALNKLSTAIIKKNEEIETNKIEFIRSFVKVLEVRDFYTKGHSERVALYSKKIAELLGLNEKRQHNLFVAGLLHDLGKVAIPDSILLKPGKLSENEYNIMKLHSVFSYEIIKDIDYFKELATFVKQHHERCDGSGYPDGLKCKEMTLEGKILAIADIFDALTTSRPYRDAYPFEKALKIMKNMPLDQSIISAAEKGLEDIYIKEKECVFPSDIISRIEKSRVDLFERDILSGLRRIGHLIRCLNKFIEKRIDFYLFMVDIKHLKKINYEFGYQKGNEVINSVVAAIKKLKFALFPSRIGSNHFAFVYTKDNPNEMKKKLQTELDKIKTNGKSVEFIITFISSSGLKSGEEAIYIAEVQIESLKYSSHKQENSSF